MNPRMLEELARQRLAEVRRMAGGYEYRSRGATPSAGNVPTGSGQAGTTHASMTRPSTRPARDTSKSLRARTGWRLVDLGLRLALQSDPRNAASPRPAGS
jgi:hypothetical protein